MRTQVGVGVDVDVGVMVGVSCVPGEGGGDLTRMKTILERMLCHKSWVLLDN